MMRKNLLGLASFILASSVLAGCGAASAGEIKVLSTDVAKQSLAQESTLQVIKKESYQIPMDVEYNGIQANKLFFNDKGKTMKFDITSKEVEPVGDMEFYDLSDNGNRALAMKDNAYYVMDLVSGENFYIHDSGADYEYYFADDEGKELIYFERKNDEYYINLIEVDSNQWTTWSITEFDLNNFTITGIEKGPDGIYTAFYDNEKHKELGLFKFNFDGTHELVNELEGIDSIDDFEFLTDTKIIFNDIYNGVSGIYTLDLQTNEVIQLVAGGKDEEGIWVPFYRLSPDKTKILFDMPVQVGKEYKANVFVGNLTDTGVTDITNVMINAETFAVIESIARWSEDSKMVYIATNEDRQSLIKKVEVFEITSK